MKYPVDNEFILHYVMLAYRRYRRWLLTGALLTGTVVGVVFFILRTVAYQVNGIVVFYEGTFVGQAVDDASQKKILHNDLLAVVKTAGGSVEDVECRIFSRTLENAFVLDWQLIFENRSVAERFLELYQGKIYDFQHRFKDLKAVFSVDTEPLLFYKLMEFCSTGLLFVCCGALTGMIFGGFLAFAGVFYDRSIGELTGFTRNYSLPIAGVLPEVDGKNLTLEKLLEDDSFCRAVNSLRLNIQLSKPSSARAWVVAVCGITGKCGTTAVAECLSRELVAAGGRVLLINDRNSNMAPARHLAGRMENFLAEHADKYDFIMLDLPDIQSSSAPLIISKLADTVVLV